MEKSGLSYVRFIDDIVVLAPSRWKLRLRREMEREMAPDKALAHGA